MKAVRKKCLSCYEQRIVEVTGCSRREAQFVEEVMRSHISHSTLDWLTAAHFAATARDAYALYLELFQGNEKFL
jgi:hypothetical protein